jgi:hypothetical protein
VALGILVLLSPWVIEALGFAEGGILEGERNYLSFVLQHHRCSCF